MTKKKSVRGNRGKKVRRKSSSFKSISGAPTKKKRSKKEKYVFTPHPFPKPKPKE